MALAILAGAAPTALAQPSAVGSWSPVYPWPDVAIHMHLLPDGRVLCWADDDNPNYNTNGTRLAGSTRAFVIELPPDGVPGAVTEVPNNRANMFCSGHSFISNGRLFVVGGHLGQDGMGETRTQFFDYQNPTIWMPGPDMFQGRWYPSASVLSTGEVLAISGSITPQPIWASIPEVWSPVTGAWRQLTNASLQLPYYPFILLAPNGKVFCAGPNVDSRYLDCTGTGAWSFVANHTGNFTRSYGSAVQYDDGKIMVAGGGDPPSATCEVINLNDASPVWHDTNAMNNARRQMNLTILADGTVLATGGTSGSGFNNNTGAVLAAELWTPSSTAPYGTWSPMASMANARLYHSTTILLPDGRVLSAGSGRPKATNGGVDQLNGEIYSPPYLFKGARPTITSAPDLVFNGTQFTIVTPDAAGITQVTLLRLGSTTHAFNMSQRFRRLTYSVGSGSLQATMPASTSLVPPGFYLLFILNGAGVPSVAKMVQVLPGGPVGVGETPADELLDFIELASANPSRGEASITFSLSRAEEARVEVLDVTGRRVKVIFDRYSDAGRQQVVVWDGTNDRGEAVRNGLYWYRLKTPTVTRTGKLALLSR